MITALVSAYYAKYYIRARLENLSAQPCDTVVICQEGSEEERIATGYPVHIITTEGIPNLYAAWNIGLSHVRDGYIVSANTDDLFYSGALERLAEYLDAHPACGVVYGDCDLRQGDIVSTWIRGAGCTPTVCRVGAMPMWRRELGEFDEAFMVAGDHDFWLRAQVNGWSVDYLPYRVGLYWRRGESIEHRNQSVLQWEKREIVKRYAQRGGKTGD